MGCCGSQPEGNSRILFSCSGACDLGQVSDLVARRLRKSGYAQQNCSCLASVGAGIKSTVDKAKAAEEVVCIDGCGVACASKMLEKIDVKPKVYTLTKMGVPSGKIDVTEALIDNLFRQFTE